MILFPNAKINIGLRILRKRPDNYHDIETIMIPLPWCDILEMVPAEDGITTFNTVGEDTLGLADPNDNLVMKALHALEDYLDKTLPPVHIYLKKVIPSGAGLGGGSSDAAFAVRGANDLFQLGLTQEDMAKIVAKVGADCPFFIYNRPMLAEGIGEILTTIEMPFLDKIYIVVAKPVTEAVSTKDAYAGVAPCELPCGCSLADGAPFEEATFPSAWINDFETSIFPLRSEIAEVKERMAQSEGCLYTAMSGSGAAVFGLFPSDKLAEKAAAIFAGCDIFTGKLSSGCLH